MIARGFKHTSQVILILAGVFAMGALHSNVWHVSIVSGVVRDSNGQAVDDAIIRIQATEISCTSDENGRFVLSGFAYPNRVRVTAWKHGYYVSGANARPWKSSIELELTAYPAHDNEDYAWIPPSVDRPAIAGTLVRTVLDLAAWGSFEKLALPLAERLTLGCRDCHARPVFDQWVQSAHASGAANFRFLTMYNGTDAAGNRSPPTRRGHNQNYGSFPMRPDLHRPYYGPGYKLDFPHTQGNCAACHLPGAAIDAPYGTDPNEVAGVNAQGSHCDFCHKITGVKLNPETARPFENMPGTLSIELMRPGADRQLFLGPYDDVDAGPDTYLPLMKKSEICAPCHNASFWGVPIYQSFAEWQASDYATEGKTCQSCHMRPDGVVTNFAPGRGGRERDPAAIATHRFPGAADTTLLRNAVTMKVTGTRDADKVAVNVTIDNDKTGHHVPTDSPLRHMILLVKATDTSGNPLVHTDGPVLPDWCGTGDPDAGSYAGLPGRVYAKVLEELWTGVSPTAAYWNRTRIVKDNRIAASASDTCIFAFRAPEEGAVAVEATLLFRRAFISLMEQKGWNVPDVVMAHRSLIVEESHASVSLRQ